MAIHPDFYSVTSGFKQVQKGLEESKTFRGMHIQFAAWEVRYSDLSGIAATAGNVTLSATHGFTFPANVLIGVAPTIIYVDTPFTGGSISAITAEVGDSGDTDELLAAVSVFSGTGWKAAVQGVKVGAVERFEASYAPVVRFSATGANLSATTAGKLRLMVPYIQVGSVPPAITR